MWLNIEHRTSPVTHLMQFKLKLEDSSNKNKTVNWLMIINFSSFVRLMPKCRFSRFVMFIIWYIICVLWRALIWMLFFFLFQYLPNTWIDYIILHTIFDDTRHTTQCMTNILKFWYLTIFERFKRTTASNQARASW